MYYTLSQLHGYQPGFHEILHHHLINKVRHVRAAERKESETAETRNAFRRTGGRAQEKSILSSGGAARVCRRTTTHDRRLSSTTACASSDDAQLAGANAPSCFDPRACQLYSPHAHSSWARERLRATW